MENPSDGVTIPASFGGVLNYLDDPVLVFDPNDHSLQHANPAALNFFGLNAAQRAQWRLEDCGVQAETLEPLWISPLATTDSHELKTELRDAGGARVPAMVRVCKPSGDTSSLVAIIRLHPNRDAMVRQLRDLQERVRLVSTCAEDGVWDWNPQTDRLYYSPRYKAILGYAEDEFEASYQNFLDHLHPDDRDRVRKEGARSRKHEGGYEIRFRMRHKNGDYRLIHCRAAVHLGNHGELLRVAGIHTDITEEEATRRALDRQQEFLRLLVDTIPQKVFWKDARGRYLGCNSHFLRYVNLREEADIVGKTPFDIYAREQAEVALETDQRILNQGKPVRGALENHRTEDGQQRIIEINKVPLRDGDGQIIGLIGTAEDITDRLEAERLLRDYNHRLEQEVEQRTRDLSRLRDEAELARQAAEVANQAKSTFLANMSHELRTPLNGILGYAQILHRNANLTEQQHEGVRIIQKSGDYLLTLINDVLDLAKIESNRIELQTVDFSLTECLRGLSELFQMRAEQKGIAFLFEPISQLPQAVRADEKRLRQILINLLSNAVKFTEQGGVNLKVGYQEQRVRFQVEDTGIGISEEELPHIFEPFRQVGDQRFRAEGTGLGLSITRQLVSLMGGDLHVSSHPGHGSLFWFSLDLPEVTTPVVLTERTEPVITGYEGPPRRLLVIDDRWENRSVMRSLLTPLGFEVLEASDGETGFAMALSENPDLILTDLVMPVLDGFEVVRRLRRIPSTAQTPVIAVSASVFDYHQAESMAAGCNAFIPKPVRADRLLTLIRDHLGLTWRQERPRSISAQHNDAAPPATPPQGEPLDEDEAMRLIDHAMHGDIHAIQNFLAQRIDDPRPVLAELRHMAEDFLVDEIAELARQRLAPGGDPSVTQE